MCWPITFLPLGNALPDHFPGERIPPYRNKYPALTPGKDRPLDPGRELFRISSLEHELHRFLEGKHDPTLLGRARELDGPGKPYHNAIPLYSPKRHPYEHKPSNKEETKKNQNPTFHQPSPPLRTREKSAGGSASTARPPR